MAQLRKLLASLTLRQKISIAVVAALVGAGLLAFTRWRRESDFKPLYTGISAEDAGPIIQKLKESGTEYRLSENGGVISVPSARIAELRIEMAAAGLPRSGRLGFEIFDKNNFGATEFVEHVNFRRALEGELERSVQCLSEVEQARVHLTFPKESVFLESREPAKASVMVKLRPGARLSPQNVIAIGYLVGSAVEGLTPEAVSIVDMRGNLLSRPHHAEGDVQQSETMLEFRQKVEKDLLAKVNTTLEPLLGPGRFRAGVSVDCDLTSGEQSEENFDPSKSVMVTSQKTEDVTTGMTAGGRPGTASNLPRPAVRTVAGTSGLTRRTENITYQSSRMVRKVRMPQGAVKRMSISVLLDQNVRWEGFGPGARRVLIPPSPEAMKTVRDLVAGVSGFVADRGDQLVVESLPFDSTLNQEPPPAQQAPPAAPGGLMDMKYLAGAVVAILLAVAVAMAFLRKRRSKTKPAPPQVDGDPALEAAPDAAGTVAPGGAVAELTAGDDAARELAAGMAEHAAAQARLDAETLRSIKLPKVTTKKTEVLVKQVRDNVKADASVPAHVLQTWIREKDK
jgi:flagellar M-ring protein FliF